MAEPPERSRPRQPLASRAIGAGARIAGATGFNRAVEGAVEESIVRAAESPAIERALVRLAEEGRLQEVIERAVAEADVEELVSRALESEASDRIWREILASEKAQLLVERVAEAPEVRAAIAQQGFGLVTDIGRRVSKLTEALDDLAERAVRRLLGRGDPESEADQAGLVTRLVAMALDGGLLLGILALTSGMLASIIPVAFGDVDGLSGLAVAGVALLAFGIVGTYLVIFWSLVGQTPGMRFLGIRLRADGAEGVGLRRSVRRLLAIPFSLIPFGLGMLSILTSERRRGWHDRFAGTEVIYDEASAPWSLQPREWARGEGPGGPAPDS